MSICFCDLDGPLLDVAEKHYRCYADIVVEGGGRPIGKEDYWRCKREHAPAAVLLEGAGGAKVESERFMATWKARVESEGYLRFDRLQPGAEAALDRLGEHYELVLVTLRASRELLMRELELLRLARRFRAVLCSGETRTPRWQIKYDAVRRRYPPAAREGGWFIGDTETDIEAGKRLGARTIAVANGIRTPERLRLASPDFLIPSIGDIGQTTIFFEDPGGTPSASSIPAAGPDCADPDGPSG